MGSGEEDPANTLKILVVTDNHLGYLEKDVLRRNDSLNTFEEILAIAKREKVDLILQGGDLFHDNKPSRYVLHRTMELLRRYCLGDAPINFEVISDQVVNFSSNSFPVVNYEDLNYNVAIPMFMIHGNHDDPAGEGNLCALNLLSVANLVNYFGKQDDVENIVVNPLLLRKGTTRMALYGLGSVRDERLHRAFQGSHVKFLKPAELSDDWFNLFMLHQNRAVHGSHNYIPESFLPSFLDLVIWGHEHACLIDPVERCSQGDDSAMYIMQPGSSVATSLCEGEATKKHVAILSVKGTNFKVEKIPLKTVRPFIFSTIDLSDSNVQPELEDEVVSYIADKVKELVAQVRVSHPDTNELPLVRLRVNTAGGYTRFSALRFGQKFVTEVANPRNILNFFTKRSGLSLATAREHGDREGGTMRLAVESTTGAIDLVVKQLENNKLSILSEKCLAETLLQFVDKEETDAITDLARYCVQETQQLLQQRACTVDTLDHVISRHQQDLKQRQETSMRNTSMRNTSVSMETTSRTAHMSEELAPSDSDNDILPPPPTRGRGRGGARKRGRTEAMETEKPTKKKRSAPATKKDGSGRGKRGK